MRRHRSILLAFALASTAVAATGPAALAQTTPSECAASFQVLHDDHIGSVPVAAGHYQLQATGVSCAQASSLFAQFLSDYDGVLPKPWRSTGENTFTRSTDGASFTFVVQGHASGSGGGTHGEFTCPGAFRVLHNDRVGGLAVPRGQYSVTLLGASLSCDDADERFAQFLDRPSGRLTGGWVVLADSGEFVRRSIRDGFRIKPLG